MAIEVNNSLGEYARRVGVQPADTAAAASHRASIKQKLESHYGSIGFFRSGSFGNGTSVTGHSDVDYFAVIERNRLPIDSNKALEEVAALLRERFPRTGVRVDRPGVRLPFGADGEELTEIIPVCATGMTVLGFRQFDMPDGNGGWMFAAPESHNAYVCETCKGLGGKVRPLIRLMKAWKFLHDIKIKSFYLEMFVTRYAAKELAIVYDIDLARLFALLRDEGLPDIIDPRFPEDGRKIAPCKTALLWADAYLAADKAAQTADAARSAAVLGDDVGCYQHWDSLFRWKLPSP